MASVDLRISVDDLWRRERGDNSRCIRPEYCPCHGGFTQLRVGDLSRENVDP